MINKDIKAHVRDYHDPKNLLTSVHQKSGLSEHCMRRAVSDEDIR
jgi:hypothetical protein